MERDRPLYLTLFLALCWAVVSVSAADSKGQQVDIPAGALPQSLERLSRDTGVQILYEPGTLQGLTAPAVTGFLTAQEALNRLLARTSLRASEYQSDTFLISTKPLPAVRPTSPPANSALIFPEANTDTPLDEVTVTGTHMRWEVPVGASLSTYGQSEFDRFGSATLDSLGRYMLENFSGADSLATVNTNGNVGNVQQGAAENIFGGAGFDLLGLGPAATLTLLNGHRIAPAGLDGSFVDMSLIPLSAIDHLEVLTDGASAIYGSDAVAGVVNIVTRRTFEGAETSLRYGRSTDGGAGEYTGSQLLGHAWSTGNVLLDYEYDDQQGLDASQRSWIGPEGGSYSLIPQNRRNSAFLAATQDAGAFTTISLSALYSARDFRTEGIQLSTTGLIPNSESAGGHVDFLWTAVTLDRTLGEDWQASATGMYSSVTQRRSAVEFTNAVNGGHFKSALFANSSVSGVEASSSGRVAELPGGAARVSIGAEVRSETFQDSVPSVEPLAPVSKSRTDLGIYGEAVAPILGKENSYPGAHRLELSLAFRADNYGHFGTSYNPKVGWLWEPASGVAVRGTYGTSFKAPLLSQLDAPATAYTTLLPGNLPDGKVTDVLVINGGNESLKSETSRAITVGLDWTPLRWSGVRGSITYFDVAYDNRIQSQNIQAKPLLSQPQLLALNSAINPPLNEVVPYFEGPALQNDGAGLGPAGVSALIDNRLANTGSTVERGIRLDGRYVHDVGFGSLGLSLSATYLGVDRTQAFSDFPVADVADTSGEPPKFRLQGGIDWKWRSLTSDLTVNYWGAYRDTLVDPVQQVGSWTTEDLAVSYSPPVVAFFSRFSVVLNLQNLLDRRPPLLAIPLSEVAVGRSAVPFDGTNASAVGRYVSLEIRTGW